MEKILYSIFNTKFGWMGIGANTYGLIAVILPQTDKEKTLSLIKKRFDENDMVRDEGYFEEIKTSLTTYFEGKKIAFDYSIRFKVCY
ncbi:hypothetical protein HY792_00585 [Candidatus Desantisbacteria bacterium]|nr:hypothetical protein [Candidatus Desantisbacteria bacterium]